jgi:hypothetical protein
MVNLLPKLAIDVCDHERILWISVGLPPRGEGGPGLDSVATTTRAPHHAQKMDSGRSTTIYDIVINT